MKTTGIICEYNPMHSGHAYQIAQARAAGAECVVLVMSGCFTQRGELAIVGKYERAETALRAGADVVVELPYPFAAGSAEYFAAAGVGVLTRLGVDTLCFGSETGDADFLDRAAEIALSDKFRTAFAEAGKSEEGSAAAYFSLLNRFLGVSAFGSNDVLGVEYLKAVKKLGSPLCPLVIRRVGAEYHAENIDGTAHPSATALRRAVEADPAHAAECYAALSGLSADVTAPFARAVRENKAPVRYENSPNALIAFYRMHSPSDFGDIAEMHGGLAERICRAARDSSDLSTFFSLSATKKYTDSRVRRAILYGLTGVTKRDLAAPPAYVNLLGASAIGRSFLSAYRKRRAGGKLPIITRPAAILEPPQDVSDAAAFLRQADLQLRAEALFTLFSPVPLPAGSFLKARAVML